jgi:hypothetical protein
MAFEPAHPVAKYRIVGACNSIWTRPAGVPNEVSPN